MAEPTAPSSVATLIRRVGTIHGKKALQKLVYFLQEGEGVALGLPFQMYHYGPYSLELESIVEELEFEGQVDVTPGDTYLITSRIDSSLPIPDGIQRVVQKLGQLPAWRLELLASLHYLAKLKPYRGTDADKEQLRQKLSAWKGTKFADAQVTQAIIQLENEGYLPAQHP